MEIRKEFIETEVGVIPKDWQIKNIANTSTIKARIGWQGLTTSEYLTVGDYCLVTGTDFFDGKIKWETCHFVNKERFVQDKNIQVKIGDILITKDGTIGKVAFVDVLPLNATLNSGVFVLRPKDNSYEPLYCYYIFNSIYFDDFLKRLVAGSTINHLYQKDFVLFNFPLPPTKSEQIAIATALSDADVLINSLEKLIEKKRNIKQGVMQELLRPKEGWAVTKLGEIATIQRGASPRPIENPMWFDENSKVGWVRISDVTNSIKYLRETKQKLSELGIRNSRLVNEGELIMSICATIGRPILTTFDVCIHDGFVAFYSPKIDRMFLYYYLTFIEKEWTKTGQTGSQMNLNSEIINSRVIAFPKDIIEQNKISEILSDIDENIFALENKLTKSKMLKQGMMQELLTGKIRLV